MLLICAGQACEQLYSGVANATEEVLDATEEVLDAVDEVTAANVNNGVALLLERLVAVQDGNRS